ncbi:hypothetical protein QQF64_029503 [Cirrhinus molitorella]|uniref:Uncharacterized protein n=1 Tax=Cirrhinus molitorella TaxID=172907 RepID=A0ABR3N0S7_9TELE
MLDDLQLLYYDSTTWIPVYRSYSDSKYYDEERSDAGVVFRDMYYDMKDRAFYLKEHQNYTDDVGESDTGYFSPSVVFSVLMFMCLAVCIIAALIIWRKRRSTCNDSVSRKSQRHYVQTQSK